jgi:hypothetical protein
MHKLQTAYTVYHNRRHRRAGHLTQDRFGAELVAGDDYLLKLSRYIHLNPVFVQGMRNRSMEDRIRHLREYRWSSYAGYAGLTKPYNFVDEHPVLALMGEPPDESRKAYGRYVEAGIAQSDEEFGDLLRTARWGIGDESFQERVRGLHAGRALEVRRPEDVSFRRVTPTVSAAAVLSAVAVVFQIEEAMLRRRLYGCRARAVAALLLGRHAGMNQRDVGAFLGMGTGSAVCRQLRGLRERMISDRSLEEIICRAEAAMHRTAPQ